MRNCSCVCALLIMSLFLAAGCKSPQSESTSEHNEPLESTEPVDDQEVVKEEAPQPLPSTTEEKPAEEQPENDLELAQQAKEKAIKAAKARDARVFYNRGLLREESGELKEAYKLFERAYELDPDYIEAHEMMVKIRIALGEVSPNTYDPLNDEVRFVKAEIAAMRRDVNNHIARAKKYYDNNDFKACIEEIGKAVSLMQRKKYGIDFSIQQAQAETILQNANREQKALDNTQDIESREASEKKLVDIIRAQDDYRKKIERQLLDQAQMALDQSNFEEALNLCLKVLEKNPLNDEAKTLQGLINQEELIYLKEYNASQEIAMWSETIRRIHEAAVPEGEIMTFMPKDDWIALIKRREMRIKEIHMIARKDDSVSVIMDKISNPARALSAIHIDRKPIPELVNSIMGMYDNIVAIYVTRPVLEEYSGEEFEIDINKSVTLKQTLDHLVKHTLTTKAAVSYTIRNEVVMITLKDAEEKRYLRIYPVQDLLMKKQDFIPPGIDIGEDIFADNDNNEIDNDDFDEDEEEDHDGRDDVHDPEDSDFGLLEIIQSTVGIAEWTPRKNRIHFDQGDMYILGTEATHETIQDLLADIRKTEDVMVTIEARFLEVSEDLAQLIGFEFTGNPDAWDIARDGRQIYTDKFLEGYLTDIADDTKSGVWFTKGSDGWVTIDDEKVYLTDGVSNGDALGWATEHALDGALTSALGLGGLGLTSGFDLNLGSVSVNFVFDIAERETRSSTMQAPVITTFNRQRAYISIIQRQRIIVGFNVNDNGDIVPDTTPISTGIVLDVMPTVTYDRKYVVLEAKLYATNPSPGDAKSFQLVRPQRNTTDDGEEPARLYEASLDIPDFTTQNIRTTVLIPDNGTVLLGGLSNYSNREGNSGIPVLSKLPVLGFFFSRKGHSIKQDVLLIILHAKITVAAYEEQKHLDK